ncbi:hypothetical protein I4U23_000172 [Adineta vaga]|nr:hypothetical protein I4U23_000172 [Adineta vaga]
MAHICSPYYLVLASIDRALITSSTVSIRQRNSHRLAYWSLFGVTFFFILYYCHLIIIVSIYYIYQNYPLCYYTPGVYRIFSGINSLVIRGFLPSFLLILFGTITLKNVRRRRIQPVNVAPNMNNIPRSKDRQLLIILLVEILGYVSLAIITNIFGLYRQSTQYQLKSAHLQAIEYFLFNILYLLSLVPISLNFYIYIYMIISKSFRQKTFEVLFQVFEHRPARAIIIRN